MYLIIITKRFFFSLLFIFIKHAVFTYIRILNTHEVNVFYRHIYDEELDEFSFTERPSPTFVFCFVLANFI